MKRKREGSLKISMEFDEAIRRALQVKPPPDGWRSLERDAGTEPERHPKRKRKAKPKPAA